MKFLCVFVWRLNAFGNDGRWWFEFLCNWNFRCFNYIMNWWKRNEHLNNRCFGCIDRFWRINDLLNFSMKFLLKNTMFQNIFLFNPAQMIFLYCKNLDKLNLFLLFRIIIRILLIFWFILFHVKEHLKIFHFNKKLYKVNFIQMKILFI